MVEPDYGDLVKGVDIIDDEISTSKAYTVFRRMQEAPEPIVFRPTDAETGGMSTNNGRLYQELPSVRIERMRHELDELQRELKELEKEEIPSRLAVQTMSAKQSLKTIDELRSFMHNVVESSSFQDMETRSNLDLKDILSKAYSKASGVAENSDGNNAQDLKRAIQ